MLSKLTPEASILPSAASQNKTVSATQLKLLINAQRNMTNSPRQVVLTGVNSKVRHTKKQPDSEDVIDLLSDTAASTVTFQIFGCSVYSTASTFVAAYLASSDQVGRGSSKMVTHYIKPSMQLGTH